MDQIISSIAIPLISGLVPIAVAIIAAKYQRRSSLRDVRLQAYREFEAAMAKWSQEKTRETFSLVFDTGNIVRLVGSKETGVAVAKVMTIIHEWGRSPDVEALQSSRLLLADSMREDIQSTWHRK